MNRRNFIATTGAAILAFPRIGVRGAFANSGGGPQYLSACLVGRAGGFHYRCTERPIPRNDGSLLRGYLQSIGTVLKVAPTLKYLGDTCDLKAYAEHTTAHDTVYIGEQMVDAEFGDSRWGDVALRGILAHECAHLVQFRSAEGASSPTLELEADYVAGYYLGVRWQKEAFDVNAFLDSIAEKSSFDDPAAAQPHGTVGERIECIRMGFKSGFLGEDTRDVFAKSRSVASSIAGH